MSSPSVRGVALAPPRGPPSPGLSCGGPGWPPRPVWEGRGWCRRWSGRWALPGLCALRPSPSWPSGSDDAAMSPGCGDRSAGHRWLVPLVPLVRCWCRWCGRRACPQAPTGAPRARAGPATSWSGCHRVPPWGHSPSAVPHDLPQTTRPFLQVLPQGNFRGWVLASRGGGGVERVGGEGGWALAPCRRGGPAGHPAFSASCLLRSPGHGATRPDGPEGVALFTAAPRPPGPGPPPLPRPHSTCGSLRAVPAWLGFQPFSPPPVRSAQPCGWDPV